MGNDWKKVFEKPGKEYRSAPFWAWNEKINEQESKFQIQEMSDKGMGGFFIHSREGLETPYLSEDWMKKKKTWKSGYMMKTNGHQDAPED